jgi:tRNA A37 threonylcarbamoyladenosine synthetase subunit TsaC/SUA5/YrdC
MSTYGNTVLRGAQGVGRLYVIKHRQAHVPLAICVADVAVVEQYSMCAHLPQGLLDDLLPGPVTVLLTRRPDAALSASLNPGVATIGEALDPPSIATLALS